MVAVWNGDRPAARRCAGLSINANFLKAYAERRRSLAENANEFTSDNYSTSRKLRQAGLGRLDPRQPRIITAPLNLTEMHSIGKTLETSDHLGLTRVPTLVYKPHRAFCFQAIPKIAIAHASTGATKNPGISLGRSCE